MLNVCANPTLLSLELACQHQYHERGALEDHRAIELRWAQKVYWCWRCAQVRELHKRESEVDLNLKVVCVRATTSTSKTRVRIKVKVEEIKAGEGSRVRWTAVCNQIRTLETTTLPEKYLCSLEWLGFLSIRLTGRGKETWRRWLSRAVLVHYGKGGRRLQIGLWVERGQEVILSSTTCCLHSDCRNAIFKVLSSHAFLLLNKTNLVDVWRDFISIILSFWIFVDSFLYWPDG